eukprot:CAMPEP_0185576642 /NCGR_PEP_ID=MMETSP0434-20130131/7520_1 /TAXON_ID=626734 ORGANISM="Favella taraikaensis, Strain Fe Narragansett Bay" /NCGR_SAMPLE_ID=MMETSP0434 /ASSEMBLY_ACC=CAM_ASM_000379 /LENGTH=46 /DNA_ID= /DNA_START= /DNA_END= /DNA_ORIENTATION=
MIELSDPEEYERERVRRACVKEQLELISEVSESSSDEDSPPKEPEV